METESQAKIAIRGKGSVKEGKGRSDAAHTSNQEEDLHCLIMADTEEKVNKAKKLIHNIIETVSHLTFSTFKGHKLIASRLHPFQKDKTSSSAINFASLLLLTVLSVMMRTRHARTVVRSATGSMTAQSSATSPPISSVVSVETLAIWQEIVRTDNVAQIGAMAHQLQVDQAARQVVQLPAGLALAMLSTASTRYVFLRSVAS